MSECTLNSMGGGSFQRVLCLVKGEKQEDALASNKIDLIFNNDNCKLYPNLLRRVYHAASREASSHRTQKYRAASMAPSCRTQDDTFPSSCKDPTYNDDATPSDTL